MPIDESALRAAYRPKPPIRSDYGIAVIGLSYGALHVWSYRQAGWRVSVACDKEASRAENGVKQGAESGVTDWRAAIDRPDVDIVDLAICQPGRTEIVEAAASLGKHVLVQKPFAHNMEDAVAMVDACERSGVRLGANQNARYVGCNRAAKWLLDQGAIGTPVLFHELHVASADIPGHAFWSTLSRFELFEMGVHYVDLLRWWAGQEPESVSASLLRSPAQRIRGEIGSIITMEFPDGARGHLTDDGIVTAPDGNMRFRIDGTEGAIKGGYDLGENPENPRWPQMNMFVELWSAQHGSQWQRWPIDDVHWVPDAHLGTMGEMMDAITEDRAPSISGRDNLNTVRLCLAAYESAEQKRAVRPSEIRASNER